MGGWLGLVLFVVAAAGAVSVCVFGALSWGYLRRTRASASRAEAAYQRADAARRRAEAAAGGSGG